MKILNYLAIPIIALILLVGCGEGNELRRQQQIEEQNRQLQEYQRQQEIYRQQINELNRRIFDLEKQQEQIEKRQKQQITQDYVTQQELEKQKKIESATISLEMAKQELKFNETLLANAQRALQQSKPSDPDYANKQGACYLAYNKVQEAKEKVYQAEAYLSGFKSGY